MEIKTYDEIIGALTEEELAERALEMTEEQAKELTEDNIQKEINSINESILYWNSAFDKAVLNKNAREMLTAYVEIDRLTEYISYLEIIRTALFGEEYENC